MLSWFGSLMGVFSLSLELVFGLITCGVSGIRYTDKLLAAHFGVRVPRDFGTGSAHTRRSRRSQSCRGRSREGGLEVTVKKQETKMKIGHEWRAKRREK